jgi:hypothetical protein
MDSLMKSDIFFFVATIALVIIAIALIVAIVYAILILRDVRAVTDRLKRGGVELGRMLTSFVTMFGRGKRKRRDH